MAYLDPQSLTCPSCGLSGDVVWIVGEGPNTRPGEGPAYVSVENAGPFTAQKKGRASTLICPVDGAEIASRP